MTTRSEIPEASTPKPAGDPVAPGGDRSASGGGRGRQRWWLAGLALAVIIVVLAAALASPDPDGLERIAEAQGFLARAQEAVFHVFADYQLPGVADPLLGTIAAGLIGLAVVFLVVVGLGRFLRRPSS